MTPATPSPITARRPGWDVLVLAVLVFAVLQIVGLAEQAALPNLLQDVLRHPLLGALLPPAGYAAMGEVNPRPGEPIGLILNALTLGALLAYALLDLALHEPQRTRWKSWLLASIILTAVVAPTIQLILLRNANGPASYTHDGGVIQTEATIRYLLEGKNPYTEDYTATPMAEWGFSQYRTALYHYPYLPWTFVFSAPFYALGQGFGFYDQRVVYLLLYGLAIFFSARLGRVSSVGLARTLSAPICTWTGLPVGGPARGAVTSTRMPGMSAAFSRILSMIVCAGSRVCQSENSNWITPIVSSVISPEPRGCSPTRV